MRISYKRDWSNRGAKPSVCYEIYEAGPRGAHVRTLLRTPRRYGVDACEADEALVKRIVQMLNDEAVEGAAR